MTDETLLTYAKLQEIAQGRLDGTSALLEHTAVVTDERDRSNLSFVANALEGPIEDTELGQETLRTLVTDEATRAVAEGKAGVASAIVGVTEQELDASSLRLPVQLLAEVENDGAPAFLSIAGNPNTGKTNLGFLGMELRKEQLEEYTIVSNVASSTSTDIVVRSAYELLMALLEHRETPKAVLLDEGSTHLDGSVYRWEVRSQLTPMAKRFAKLGVDQFTAIGHTGKDLHPEVKRLTTLAAFKSDRTTAEFFESWPSDSDRPTGRKFGGELEEIEPAVDGYDADDAAPWAWNLPEDVWTKDYDWPELLDWLRERGPATDS